MSNLLKPKEVTLIDLDGDEHKFNIGRYDLESGLSIIAEFPSIAGSLLKNPNTENVRDFCWKVLKFSEIVKDDVTIQLKTKDLVLNHIIDPELCYKLVLLIHAHNTNFSKPENLYGILDKFSGIAKPLITKTLTLFMDSLSKNASQPQKNSEQSTT